jgi:LPS export ABC transporter protein LptC
MFSNTIKILSFLFSLFIVVACENNIDEVNELTTDNSDLPVETTFGVEFYYSDSAQIEMKLLAGKIDRFVGKENYFDMSQSVEMYFYDSFPHIQTKLTAVNGIGYEIAGELNKMVYSNNVILINEEGDKLLTEKLTWDGKTHRIFTKEFVKIITEDEELWGYGLESDEEFNQFEIKNVKGQINISDTL